MKRNGGFTLLEMMIVVAIIGVILSVAIPNMLRARAEANEASAIGDLRTIGQAQIAYSTARNTYGDFDALTSDTDGEGTSFLDESWSEGRNKAGYEFSIPQADGIVFVCFADPLALNGSGTRYFRIDPSGVVRYSKSGQPTASDPEVGSQSGG